jgi:hypothetical protein
VKVSHKYSNGLEVEETARTGKGLRIQKFSDDVSLKTKIFT